MRTILVPTDFTVESLMAVKKILHENTGEPVKIILFHCVVLTDSITDLLTFSKSRLLKSLTRQTFDEACEIIRNKFSQSLHGLYVDVFTGGTVPAFHRFVEANQATGIAVMDNFAYRNASKYSIDPMRFVAKAKVPVTVVTVVESPVTKNQLAALFSESV